MFPENPTQFPVSSYAMVEALTTFCSLYETAFPVLQGVRIGTKRDTPQQGSTNSKQIIVTPIAGGYAPSLLKKKQPYNINFFTDDYEDAEELAVALEVVFQSIRNEVFHWVAVTVAPMEVPDSPFVNENHYWMALDTLIAGKPISLYI